MKNILTLVLFLFTFHLFSQTLAKQESTSKGYYSDSSKIKIIYTDSLKNHHSNNKPAAFFVNGTFIGNESILGIIDSDKIEAIDVQKEGFERNGKAYYGKVLIEMKIEYNPNFITINELATKYFNLNTNPIVFQINENVINEDYNEFLIDESFILKMELNNIKTSEKNTVINLIKITTRTSENIKKANEIRIRGKQI